MSETPNLPIKWEDQLSKMAQAVAETERVQGQFVSFKGGMLAYNGQVIPGNKINVIILDHVFENQYYKDRYNPNVIVSPTCYALNRVESQLAPNPDLVTTAQALSCAECAWAEWGSDPDGGKGKGCKNTRRLAMFADTALETVESLQAAEIVFAKLPVTSVRNWSNYAVQIANVVRRPPLGVITEMSVVPDPKNQFQVRFNYIDTVPDDWMPYILEKKEALADGILFDYPKNDENAPPPARPAPQAPAGPRPVTPRAPGKF